jgi:hypothetical protein
MKRMYCKVNITCSKKYNGINNPNQGTPLHRQNENYWIRELGTATPYGCNHKIDGIDRVRPWFGLLIPLYFFGSYRSDLIKCW